MKIFGECEVPLCHRYGFFIRKRVMYRPEIGYMTSKTRMCGKCARRIKSMVK